MCAKCNTFILKILCIISIPKLDFNIPTCIINQSNFTTKATNEAEGRFDTKYI